MYQRLIYRSSSVEQLSIEPTGNGFFTLSKFLNVESNFLFSGECLMFQHMMKFKKLLQVKELTMGRYDLDIYAQ